MWKLTIADYLLLLVLTGCVVIGSIAEEGKAIAFVTVAVVGIIYVWLNIRYHRNRK